MRDLATHLKMATAGDSRREWSMWNGALERILEIARDREVVAMRNILIDVTDTITTITMRSILVRIQIRYIL
jgi:hypothetical protein